MFGPDLLAPEPSHTPAALAAATFHAEQEAAAQAVADVYGDTPTTAALQEGKPKQTRRVHRVDVFVPPEATPAHALSAIEDFQEAVGTAGDQEFLSGRDAIAQANPKASEGKPACSPGMPLSAEESDAGARKKKSRQKRKLTPQAGTSSDVQASAKAGKENRQQAEAARGGGPAKASAASGTAGHKPRSAASMACATKLLARLLDAVDEGKVKGNDLDEACDSDVDMVEVADALTQMSESPRRMTDEERRLQMDWADAETPETAKRHSAARVDQKASSSIKALLGVTTSRSLQFQEAPLAAAGEEHGIDLQGQAAAVASSTVQGSEGLAETGMATEDQEKLIPGVWELQVSLEPSQEDQDIPADAAVEDAASPYSAQSPNIADQDNMAVAVNATSATNILDTPELAAVGQGSAYPRANSSASGVETQTWKPTVTEENTAAKIADEEDMLSSEGGTPLTAEALEKFNRHNRCMPARSPEGHTYLTPEALVNFKAFLEDDSGSDSSEAGRHLAANRQEPSPGSDLTPMIAKAPLFTIPEQSEAEEQDKASEDGPDENGKEILAAGTVAAHIHVQTECVDW